MTIVIIIFNILLIPVILWVAFKMYLKRNSDEVGDD